MFYIEVDGVAMGSTLDRKYWQTVSFNIKKKTGWINVP